MSLQNFPLFVDSGYSYIFDNTCFPQGIDSLFKKINCDQSSIVEMLGGQAGVTDQNMMQVCRNSFVDAASCFLTT